MKAFRWLYSINIYLPRTTNRNMNIHHKVAARYSLIDTPQRLFVNCICIYCKKGDHEVTQNNSSTERRIPPYGLPLTNFSCKTKKHPYQQIRAFQTYLSLENNIVMLHFPTDSARSAGTSPKLRQRGLSLVHWQQPRAACRAFKGGFTESWCPVVTIRSLLWHCAPLPSPPDLFP